MRGASFCLSLTLLGCGIDGQIDLLGESTPVISTPDDGSGAEEGSPGTSELDASSDSRASEAQDETGSCEQNCVSPAPYCDVASGACVACLGDDHCAGTSDRHLCDPATHGCVECILDSDCAFELSAKCDRAHGDCVH